MIQHEQALLDKIGRIKAAAKTMYATTMRYEHILISVSIERRGSSDNTIELSHVKEVINTYVNQPIPEGHDFEDIIGELYDRLVSKYYERDIKICVIDTNTAVSVEKIYNTHRPVQQLAI